jgi:hypothetical protein
MKILCQTTVFVLFICLFTACASKAIIYNGKDFPLYKELSYKNQTNVDMPLFNQKIFTMHIYQILDTFKSDKRQQYKNRRTISKDDSLVNLKDKKLELLQTLGIFFLDDERVMYYSDLQSNPILADVKTALLPQKICLTDNPAMKRDLTVEDKYRTWVVPKFIQRHLYHGIYRWDTANTMQIEFQKTYTYKPNRFAVFFKSINCSIFKKGAFRNNLYWNRIANEQNSKKAKFVRFYCAVSPQSDSLTVKNVAYAEKDILAGTEEVKINVKDVFGEQFNVAFIATDNSEIRKSQYNTVPINNKQKEVIYDLNAKTILYNTISDAGIPEKTNSFKKLNTDSIESALTVKKCTISFPFDDQSKLTTAQINYVFNNGVNRDKPYTFSPELTSELERIADGRIVNKSLEIEIMGSKLLGFFDIYDKLKTTNKKDFKNFITKIASFDEYKECIYANNDYESFVKNEYVSVRVKDLNYYVDSDDAIKSKVLFTYRVLSDTLMKKKVNPLKSKYARQEFEFKVHGNITSAEITENDTVKYSTRRYKIDLTDSITVRYVFCVVKKQKDKVVYAVVGKNRSIVTDTISRKINSSNASEIIDKMNSDKLYAKMGVKYDAVGKYFYLEERVKMVNKNSNPLIRETPSF